MKLGLIAGNGRFPFLVLDAARSMGHDVTVIALKEEASKEIEAAAAQGATPSTVHWISIGQLGPFLEIQPSASRTRSWPARETRDSALHADLTAMSLLTRLKSMNTDSLIAAVGDLMRGTASSRSIPRRSEPLSPAKGKARGPDEFDERLDSAIGWRTPSPASTSARPSP